MSEDQGAAQGAAQEPVGSVGEEAAKLMAALSGWAKVHGEEVADGATSAAHGVAEAWHDVNDHTATGAAECRYCPVCQVIHAVRGTSPEVRQHLSVAASSLAQAFAGMLATAPQSHRKGADTAGGSAPGSGVEKIDLDNDVPWPEEPPR